MISGLIPHFYPGELRGEVEVLGRDIRSVQPRELLSKVGYVLQNPDSQIISNKARRELEFPLENRGYPQQEIRRRVEEVVELLGIWDIVDRYTFELSGGQKQKLAIASVLVTGPELLILDEPLAYLSPRSASNLVDTLARIRSRTGATVMILEHRLDLLLGKSTKVVVMRDGRILDVGGPREVFRRVVEGRLPINVPSVVKLYVGLRRRGIEMEEIPLSPEEAGLLLRRILNDD